MRVDFADPQSSNAAGMRLEQAFLSVQKERVALTECLTRLGPKGEATGVEALIIRLLRLQRTVTVVRDVGTSHP